MSSGMPSNELHEDCCNQEQHDLWILDKADVVVYAFRCWVAWVQWCSDACGEGEGSGMWHGDKVKELSFKCFASVMQARLSLASSLFHE